MTTIAICTPNLGTITAACTRAIMTAQAACQVQGRDYFFLHVDIETVIIGKARSLLTHTALNAGADVLFFVDQDVEVPPHAIIALMDRDLPIVGGLYIARREPYLPQIYTTAQPGEGLAPPFSTVITTPRDLYWPITEYDSSSQGVMEVDAIGAGCLMVKREVFEKLAANHAAVDAALNDILEDLRSTLSEAHYAIAKEHIRMMDPWFEFLNDEGEDLYFCRQARRAGYKIHCDLSVKCRHLGIVPIEEAHFLYIKPHLRRLEAANEDPDDAAPGG